MDRTLELIYLIVEDLRDLLHAMLTSWAKCGVWEIEGHLVCRSPRVVTPHHFLKFKSIFVNLHDRFLQVVIRNGILLEASPPNYSELDPPNLKFSQAVVPRKAVHVRVNANLDPSAKEHIERSIEQQCNETQHIGINTLTEPARAAFQKVRYSHEGQGNKICFLWKL